MTSSDRGTSGGASNRIRKRGAFDEVEEGSDVLNSGDFFTARDDDVCDFFRMNLRVKNRASSAVAKFLFPEVQ